MGKMGLQPDLDLFGSICFLIRIRMNSGVSGVGVGLVGSGRMFSLFKVLGKFDYP